MKKYRNVKLRVRLQGSPPSSWCGLQEKCLVDLAFPEMRYRFFATTITGLEDLAARECAEVAGVIAELDVGKVLFEADLRQAITLNLASRMLHRIFLLLARKDVETLEDVYRVAREVDYEGLIGREQSFAVRAERHAKHYPFTSLDIAATVGRAVIESYRESAGVRLRVNLDEPDVELYCLLRDSELLIGLNTTGGSLHRRFYRVYHHRAALHPTIAAGMLRLAGWRRDEALLDPMCGGGTIPIEAALLARKVPPGLRRGGLALERLKFVDPAALEEVARELKESTEPKYMSPILGSDASKRSVEGARVNAEKAGVADTVRLLVADALRMKEWLREEPEHVAVNPPYGLRMGIRDIETFYLKFLESLRKAAPSARLTAIVSKPTVFSRALQASGYQTLFERPVMYGRLKAVIFGAER